MGCSFLILPLDRLTPMRLPAMWSERSIAAMFRSWFSSRLIPLALALVLVPIGVEGSEPARARDSTIVVISGNTEYELRLKQILGAYGDGPGEMTYPQGVAVDGVGRIFVSDTGNHRVIRFDPEGRYLGEFGGLGFEPGRFDTPRDLFIGEALQVWVLDGENRRIVKYDLRGNLLGLVLDLESEDVRFSLGSIRPGGLSADSGGRLFITDTAADRVVTYEPLSGELNELGGYGSQPGRFRYPTGITVEERGTLLIADGGNRRVQALDGFGGFVRAWPMSGAHPSGRVSVAWLPQNRLAVAEADSSVLRILAEDGRLLAERAIAGDGAGELANPHAVTADRSGLIYVADTDNHRIQIFEFVEKRSESAP